MNEIAFRSPKNVLNRHRRAGGGELAPREWGRGRLLDGAGRSLAHQRRARGRRAPWSRSKSPVVLCRRGGPRRLPDLDLIVVGRAAGGRTVVAALPLADDPPRPPPSTNRCSSWWRGRYAGVPRAEQMSRSVFGVPSSAIGALRLRLALSVTWAAVGGGDGEEIARRRCWCCTSCALHLSPGQVVATHAAPTSTPICGGSRSMT